MKRSGTATFVLTLPLVVKPGEDRNLIGRLEAGRRLMNATLGASVNFSASRKKRDSPQRH
jgi:hypothetical protein